MGAPVPFIYMPCGLETAHTRARCHEAARMEVPECGEATNSTAVMYVSSGDTLRHAFELRKSKHPQRFRTQPSSHGTKPKQILALKDNYIYI